jgi:hypothetical protein
MTALTATTIAAVNALIGYCRENANDPHPNCVEYVPAFFDCLRRLSVALDTGHAEPVVAALIHVFYSDAYYGSSYDHNDAQRAAFFGAVESEMRAWFVVEDADDFARFLAETLTSDGLAGEESYAGQVWLTAEIAARKAA